MKQIYFFLLFLFGINFTQLHAEPLAYTTENTLFNHLTTVNEQWLCQDDLEDFSTIVNQQTTFQNDILRIQKHLELVHTILSQRSTLHLSKQQMANRKQHLTVLKTYYQSAKFPTNLYHSKRQPYFVDDFGVHCAVGYLLQQDGQIDFVKTIHQKDNYAYIYELTKYPALENWAKANGFTIDELAWIQPGYMPTNGFAAVGTGVNGEILCFEQSTNGETLFIGGDFTTIDGINSPAVAAFDGTTFSPIGGLVGKVHDMKYHNGKLYVVGSFAIGQTAVNIAAWDGTAWTALQNGDMQGTIYTIEILNANLYIGGDFQKIDNNDMPYLAYYKLSDDVWSKEGRKYINGNPTIVYNGFSVNDAVYKIEEIEGKLLIGGAYTEVAPTVLVPNYNTFSTTHIAYWDDSGQWITGFNTQNGVVHSIRYFNGHVYIGSELGAGQNSISILAAGLWSYDSHLTGFTTEHILQDFFEFNAKIYAIGDLEYLPFLGTYGRGIVEVYQNNDNIWTQGAAVTNGSVKAAIEFKGQAYFGGNFDTVSNVVINGFMVSDLDQVFNTNNIEQEKTYKVWYAANRIIIESKRFQSSDFTLYNVNGQVVYQTQNIRTQRHEIPSTALPKGVYFYEIRSEDKRENGKIAIY